MEGGEEERSCYRLNVTPIPYPPASLGPGMEGGIGARTEEVKLCLESRGMWR